MKARNDIVTQVMNKTTMSHVRIFLNAYEYEDVPMYVLTEGMVLWYNGGKAPKIVIDYCKEVLNAP